MNIEFKVLLFLIFIYLFILFFIFFCGRKREKERYKLRLFIFINNHLKQIRVMKINQQEFANARLGLVDSETKLPVEGATFADISLRSSDEGIFTVSTDVNADGELDVVGVAPGQAKLLAKATVSYTDANTNQSVTKVVETAVDIVVYEPAPDAQSTELVVTFTEPAKVPE